MSVPLPSRHVLLVIAATACWGFGTVLSKQALEHGVAPLSLLVIELAASCLVLALGVAGLGVGVSSPAALARLAALGLLNPSLAYVLALFGLVTVSASLAVLLWATEPVLIAVLAVVFLGERVGLVTGAAIAVAVLGAVLVIHHPGAAGGVGGIVLTLGAVTACACYTVLTRRLLLDDSSLVVVLSQQAVALVLALLLLLAGALGGVDAVRLPSDLAGWAFAIGSGVVYYGLAFACFVAGLRGLSASRAGTLLPLIPVFGLAGGFLVGDRLEGRQWLGVVLVILATTAGSVAAARRSAKPRPRAHA